MSESGKQITMNGQTVSFTEGETLVTIASRNGWDIPTLCHDPRLDPAGACRSCLVEVKGSNRLVPSCAQKAEEGMTVTTESERIQRHRQSLFALYLTDHPEKNSANGSPNQLLDMAERYKAPTNWGKMDSIRAGREQDRNPYIHFDAAACIACARCVRYCDEVEAVSAITLAGRGSETTISTADEISLLDSTCEMCGGCIDVCPSGAMIEKLPLTRNLKPDQELKKVRSTCNFCGVGCQMDINVDPLANNGRGQVVKITSPPPGTTTNDGNLCVKGRFAYDFIHHEDRLTQPLVRGEDGEFHPATWDVALQKAALGLQSVAERHGADALGFISSSRCTMEENYLVQKLSRAVFRTNNVHQCAAT
jgi:predicted molibdopterin-dependent oxidoreductase YjgC